jgi:hypothetical protein
MMLLRYNRDPVEFEPEDVESIEEGSTLTRVNLRNGESYLGYHIKKD